MNIVIITGASSGMGTEFALQLDAALSMKKVDEIWLIARRKEALLEVASVLEHTTRVLDMDVTKQSDVDRFKALLSRERPNIRMLVNCAGYGVLGAFDEQSEADVLGMIDLNCRALTQMTHICLPYMRKNSRMIQLASSAAFIPQKSFAVYAATKSYVLSFSRGLNEDLKKRGIHVTAVCPGPVDTPFFDLAEKDGDTLAIKKLVMAKAELVVEQAIRASRAKKSMVVYGLPMRASLLFTKLLPHDFILAVMRHFK